MYLQKTKKMNSYLTSVESYIFLHRTADCHEIKYHTKTLLKFVFVYDRFKS